MAGGNTVATKGHILQVICSTSRVWGDSGRGDIPGSPVTKYLQC